MAPVLKTGRPQGRAGSNPVLSFDLNPREPARQGPLRSMDLPLENLTETWAIQARKAYIDGRFDDALAHCAEARQDHSNSSDASFLEALIYLMSDRLDEAETAIRTCLTSAPDFPNGNWLLAGLLLRRYGENDPRVIAAYEAVLASEPENLYARCEWGDLLRALGRSDEARDLFDDLRVRPVADEALRVEAAFKLGCVELVLGRNLEAHAAFQQVLDVAPDYLAADEMAALAASDLPNL